VKECSVKQKSCNDDAMGGKENAPKVILDYSREKKVKKVDDIILEWLPRSWESSHSSLII